MFAEHARRYYDAGLPVIPLVPAQKRPAIAGWQRFSQEMPDVETREAWIRHFADSNIGLVLGQVSGLIAVDIDVDDPKVIAILDSILPSTPWVRHGRKGEVRIYRWSGQRTQRLIASGVGTVCEFLSTGTQVVLPPSIHPDTQRPYRANSELVEVLKQVVTLPEGIEDRIREKLVEAGYEVNTGGAAKVVSYVPVGARDNAMAAHAGLLARGVTRGERTLAEAIREITFWAENYVEQVVGDPLDPTKARSKLVEFLIRDVTGILQKTLPPGWDDGLTEQDKEDLGVAEFSEEQEAWAVPRILEWATGRFLEASNDDDKMMVIHKCLSRAARLGRDLGALDEERLLKVLVSQTKGVLTVGALRKELREMRKGDIDGDNHEEIARAVKAWLDQYGEIRYDAEKFWQWKGSHWVEKDPREIERIVAEEFGNFPVCKRQSDYRAIVKLLEATAADSLVKVSYKGINFANGFLTEELDLVDHHPDFGQTYVLEYRYLSRSEAGKMMMFEEFLRESWAHDGADFELKMQGLQEAIGATLFGVATRYQKAFCLYGKAQSGKSTMSKIVRALLPSDGVSAVPPQDWNDRFAPAQMFGKIFNFAGELSEVRMIAGDYFKQIVEGEQIQAQHKNKPLFKFNPQCAHWFNSNHLPKTQDTSMGFNRRWLFLEWTKTIPDHKKIPDLDRLIVEAEREAIVSWAVEGFARLKKQGDYTMSASHLAKVDQMAVANNSVRFFLSASPRLKLGGKGETGVAEVYNEYLSFCLATGVVRRASTTVFQTEMRDLADTFGFVVDHKSRKMGSQEEVYRGLEVGRA